MPLDLADSVRQLRLERMACWGSLVCNSRKNEKHRFWNSEYRPLSWCNRIFCGSISVRPGLSKAAPTPQLRHNYATLQRNSYMMGTFLKFLIWLDCLTSRDVSAWFWVPKNTIDVKSKAAHTNALFSRALYQKAPNRAHARAQEVRLPKGLRYWLLFPKGFLPVPSLAPLIWHWQFGSEFVLLGRYCEPARQALSPFLIVVDYSWIFINRCL